MVRTDRVQATSLSCCPRSKILTGIFRNNRNVRLARAQRVTGIARRNYRSELLIRGFITLRGMASRYRRRAQVRESADVRTFASYLWPEGRESRRDGFAGDCPPATQSQPCSHSGIVRGSPPFFSLYLRALSTVAGGEPGGQTRPGQDDAPGVRVIVSRAGFPGPGCALVRASRNTAPVESGRQIGLRRGPMLSPSPSVVVPARIGHAGYPA